MGDKVVGVHPSLAKFWLSEVVSAIEHMHRRGLVHRDLKVWCCVVTGTRIAVCTFFMKIGNIRIIGSISLPVSNNFPAIIIS